jgi:hypothetical protein
MEPQYLYTSQESSLRWSLLIIFSLGLRTRLIDAISTPDLLKMVEAGGIDPNFLVSHSSYDSILYTC